MEWSQVLYSSDCCMYVAGGVSARLYTIRYIMASNFQRRPVMLFHHRRNTAGSSVITRDETNNSALDCLDLADVLILSWARAGLQSVNA
jgi:hypothetical protein